MLLIYVELMKGKISEILTLLMKKEEMKSPKYDVAKDEA